MPIRALRQAWPFPIRSAFLRGIATPQLYAGLRDNCIYDGAAHVPIEANFVLSVEAEVGALVVRDAVVRDAGGADEYQVRCVAQWLTDSRVEVAGVEPGARYRVVLPLRM